MKKTLISACLLGLNTRYDGTNKNKRNRFVKKTNFIPVCPEQLGGLTTPREPADITYENGKKIVRTKLSDKNITRNFKKGAKETLKICKILNINKAILKSDSPSCGKNGLTYELLSKNNIDIKIVN